MLDAKIASALNKIIQNSQFQMSASRSRKPIKRTGFCERQLAFMIYDYFRVTGVHDAVLDYADLFSVTLHDDNIQEFDTRWVEVLSSMTKFHPMKSWKVCTNWEYVSLINSITYWNSTTWRFIRRHRFLTIKGWKPWWKMYMSKTPFTKLSPQAWERWIWSRGKES